MKRLIVDTNVISKVLKGDLELASVLRNHDVFIDSTVYIECIQGSKSSSEKILIKNFLDEFPLILPTTAYAERAIALIDRYSNSHGLLLADAQIAAACLEGGLSLLTFNLSDFSFIADLDVVAPDVLQSQDRT